MFKKSFLFFFFIIILSFPLPAEESVLWGSHYSPGNLIFSGGVGIERRANYEDSYLTLYPHFEILLFKPKSQGLAFFDLGAAVKARAGIPLGGDNSFTLGVAPTVTLHLGFRGFDFTGSEYLDRLDVYGDLGLGIDFIGDGNELNFVFAGSSGLGWHINDSLSVRGGFTSWGDYSGASIAAALRFGPLPEVKGFEQKTIGLTEGSGATPVMAPMYTEMYISQFYLYYMSFYTLGGFSFDDSGYEVGTGTVWRITQLENGETFTMEKALLADEGGSRWWKMAVSDAADRWIYEFREDEAGSIVEARFLDEEGNAQTVAIGEQTRMKYETTPMTPFPEENASEWSKGNQRITVEAGTYMTELYENRIAEGDLQWSGWVTPEVPGMFVKYIQRYGKEGLEGELIQITQGNRSELK